MTRRTRAGFGAAALGFWLVSLALPAYVTRTEVLPGWMVLLIGWLDLPDLLIVPGSPLGWIDNLLTPVLAVLLLTGRPVGSETRGSHPAVRGDGVRRA